eukprot:g63232.t1
MWSSLHPTAIGLCQIYTILSAGTDRVSTLNMIIVNRQSLQNFLSFESFTMPIHLHRLIRTLTLCELQSHGNTANPSQLEVMWKDAWCPKAHCDRAPGRGGLCQKTLTIKNDQVLGSHPVPTALKETASDCESHGTLGKICREAEIAAAGCRDRPPPRALLRKSSTESDLRRVRQTMTGQGRGAPRHCFVAVQKGQGDHAGP